jgi:hypothetical protein
MKKFEYKILYEYPKISFEVFLNELGSEGWELINFNLQSNSLTGIATFKRELRVVTN